MGGMANLHPRTPSPLLISKGEGEQMRGERVPGKATALI